MFPEEIEAFQFSSGEFPNWLTENTRINSISEEGVYNIATRDSSKGGVIIYGVDGVTTLLSLLSKDDFICKDISSGHILSLTEEQLKLLYQV